VDKPEVPRFFQATRDGTLWIAATYPVDVLRIGPQGNREAGIGARSLLGMCEDENGTVWAVEQYTKVDPVEKLLRYQQGQFVSVPLDRNAQADYRSIACGQAGRIWLFDTQRGVFRYADGKLKMLTDNVERARRFGNLYADPRGRVWLGEAGRVRLYEHEESHQFGKSDGLPAGAIFVIYMSREGNLWVGGDGGLGKFENGRFRFFSQSNGLPAHSVYGIAEDESGSLWLACDSGVLRVPILELDRAISDPTYLIPDASCRSLSLQWPSGSQGR
jgi:ligand-binding sensor domain-containing protein